MSQSSTTISSYQLFENSVNLIGRTLISGVAYGIMFTIYTICSLALVRNIRMSKHDPPLRRRSWCFLTYISAMFILGTLSMAANARGAQVSYVYGRDYLGDSDSLTYAMGVRRQSVILMGTVSHTLACIMADSLVLWRVMVLYHTSRYRLWASLLPALLLCGVIVMGICVIVQAYNLDLTFYSQRSTQFAIPYYACSVALSLTSTFLIVARLCLHKRRLDNTMSNSNTSPYIGIILIVIECSGLYSLWSLLFLITYVTNHPLQFVFLSSLAQVQIMAPLLIILFVAQGRAWSQQSRFSSVGQIQFAPGPMFEAQSGQVDTDVTLPPPVTYSMAKGGTTYRPRST
ncbi:hypothetical protein BS17DRAFT_773639 [Gyrodon lividus]|nr:hypothetical protein BS17DRAFT_773639 [Gyrodon lividus]